ncbi:MAG: hypothetical protein H4O13_18890 [Xanthomonadales bacterium]|nr:hypothetical protein [Xanthomonadales bacterium]
MPDKLLILPAPLESVSALISGIETERPPTAVDAATFVLLAFAATGTIDKPLGNASRFLSDAVQSLRSPEQRTNAIEQARELVYAHRLAATLIKACRNLGLGLVTAKELEGIRLYAPDGSFSSDIADQIDARQIFTVETRHTPFAGPRDQVAALMALRSDFREFSNVEAFAGTGKTHLIRTLLAADPPKGSIYMVQSRDQGIGLGTDANPDVGVLTWWQVLNMSLEAFVHRHRFAKMQRHPYGGFGQHPELLKKRAAEFEVSESLIEAAYWTLRRWAPRNERDIASVHVPYPLRPDGLSGNLATDQQRVAELARQLWSQQDGLLHGRSATIPLTTSLYARFLERNNIPLAVQGTIFLDEAHNTPAALARLLEAHEGGAVCFGDSYQAFGRRPPAWQRGRQLTMSQSVRFGGAATSLVNSAIDLLDKDALGQRVLPNVTINTKVMTMRGDEGRNAAGLHVYGSPATLLRDAMRFLSHRQRVYINGFSQKACKAWAEHASTALSQDRAGAGAGLLHRIEALAKASDDPHLLGWVVQSFSRLQDSAGVDLVLDASTDPNRATWLVLAESSRNLEKPVVAIHPCCFARELTNDHIKHYYVAASRARETIWLPSNAWR